MNHNDYIYPEVKTVCASAKEGEADIFFISMTTILRKKDDEGKWRLCHYWYRHVFGPAEPSETEKQRTVQRFQREVYFFLIKGRPNGLIDTDGFELYPVDTNQQDEGDRLEAVYQYLGPAKNSN